MHQYGVRDIEKLLGLPRSAIRALIKAGFVTPERGPRNAWRFSFQDLIVLRTAQALSASLVPYRRITKALKELRRNLPEEMPLSGLRIAAVGDHGRRQGRRCALAGRNGPVPARLRRRSGRRRAERRRADADARRTTPSRRAHARRRRRARAARHARRNRSVPAIDRDRSRAPGRSHESRAPPARKRPPVRSRAGLSRRAEELRQRRVAALQLRRAARRHGSQGRGDGGVSSSRCAAIRRWPIATTTWRCSTRSSSGRRMQSGTWRSIEGSSRASRRTELSLSPLPLAGEG